MGHYTLFEIECGQFGDRLCVFPAGCPGSGADLKDGDVVTLGNVSPASWLSVNPGYQELMTALEARAPLGWEHVQLDGVCRYDLRIDSRTRKES